MSNTEHQNCFKVFFCAYLLFYFKILFQSQYHLLTGFKLLLPISTCYYVYQGNCFPDTDQLLVTPSKTPFAFTDWLIFRPLKVIITTVVSISGLVIFNRVTGPNFTKMPLKQFVNYSNLDELLNIVYNLSFIVLIQLLVASILVWSYVGLTLLLTYFLQITGINGYNARTHRMSFMHRLLNISGWTLIFSLIAYQILKIFSVDSTRWIYNCILTTIQNFFKLINLEFLNGVLNKTLNKNANRYSRAVFLTEDPLNISTTLLAFNNLLAFYYGLWMHHLVDAMGILFPYLGYQYRNSQLVLLVVLGVFFSYVFFNLNYTCLLIYENYGFKVYYMLQYLKKRPHFWQFPVSN